MTTLPDSVLQQTNLDIELAPKKARPRLGDLKVKIYADGADKAAMLEMYSDPLVSGFTTNPTLMRKAGVSDYQAFAKEMLRLIPDRPMSFEVFADEYEEMEQQALEIAGWGKNVLVKIPVTNTRGEPSDKLLTSLASAGVKLNVTALLTLGQVGRVRHSGRWTALQNFSLRRTDR